MVGIGDLLNISGDVARVATDPGGMVGDILGQLVHRQGASDTGGGNTTAAQFDQNNPQYNQQMQAGGAGDPTAFSFDGIHLSNGKTLSWQQLASMTDDQAQATLTGQAGFSTDQASQLILTLRKNKNIVWSAEDPGNPNSLKEWTDPNFAKLANDVGRTAKNTAMSGVAPGAAAQPTVNAAMTPQAMQDYYNNIMAPALANYQHVVNGDMAQWGSMINNIMANTKGSDVTFQAPNLQLYGQLQDLYGMSSMLNQAFGPTFNYLNQVAGMDTKVAMANQAAGAKEQALFQAAQSDPSLMNLISGSGLQGALTTPTGPATPGTTGSNPSQIVGQILAGANANKNNPQYQPITGATPTG